MLMRLKDLMLNCLPSKFNFELQILNLVIFSIWLPISIYTKNHYLVDKYNTLVMKLLNNHITNCSLPRCSSPSNTCHKSKNNENMESKLQCLLFCKLHLTSITCTHTFTPSSKMQKPE